MTDDTAFGNEIAQTDDTAFGNEIAQTDDYVIVEATRTSALPNKGRLLSPQGARSKGMMSPLSPKKQLNEIVSDYVVQTTPSHTH